MKGLLTAQNNMRRHDALIIAAKKETTATTIQNQTTSKMWVRARTTPLIAAASAHSKHLMVSQ
jgi:hypothetical protein